MLTVGVVAWGGETGVPSPKLLTCKLITISCRTGRHKFVLTSEPDKPPKSDAQHEGSMREEGGGDGAALGGACPGYGGGTSAHMKAELRLSTVLAADSEPTKSKLIYILFLIK